MKKLRLTAALLALALMLSACAQQQTAQQTDGSSTASAGSAAQEQADGSGTEPKVQARAYAEAHASTAEASSGILIAYFSRVGNTDFDADADVSSSASINDVDGEYCGNAQLIAQAAQQVTGGDLFFIQTVERYPSSYDETTTVAQQEQNADARPALAAKVENMDAYSTVILVYPNWWGTIPQAVATFLESYDFSGKTILPICTHGGSQMGTSEADIAALCPDASLAAGLAVPASDAAAAQDAVQQWLSEVNAA